MDRSPPPPKTTTVQIQERSRDEDTGEVELKVTPINGDIVYAEIDGEATPASQKVENGLYVTDEMEVSFLAVDSTGVHASGPRVSWQNRVTLKYRFFTGGNGERMLELKAAPSDNTEIRYTTDGSDPKVSGGTYDSPVAIKPGTQLVLAYAECGGVQSDVLQIPVPVGKGPVEEKPIDPTKPAVWKRAHAYYFTPESYEFMERLKRHEAKISGAKLSITGDRWLELTLHELVELDAAQVSTTVETLRALPVTGNGQVEVSCAALHFPTGQRLLDWLNEVKTDVKPGEVKQ